MRRLDVGAAGAVSMPGIAAGLLGAAALGSAGYLAGLFPVSAVVVVAAAGLAGSLAESVAQQLARRRGLSLDHDFANAFNTFAGALIALEVSLSVQARGLFLPIAGA